MLDESEAVLETCEHGKFALKNKSYLFFRKIFNLKWIFPEEQIERSRLVVSACAPVCVAHSDLKILSFSKIRKFKVGCKISRNV